MTLRGRALAPPAALATVLAKMAVLAGQEGVEGPPVTGALLGWSWPLRRPEPSCRRETASTRPTPDRRRP